MLNAQQKFKITPVGEIPVDWSVATIDKLAQFFNGRGYGPDDWKETGIPIIRIQNLNGSQKFNFYQGKTEDSWFVNTGDLLFAWAGTKGVSFGPAIWKGKNGLLNQHIYKVIPKNSASKEWLFLVLQRATLEIERKAHGFKSTLLHVGKKDIIGQKIALPPLAEQQKIADILGTWDRAIEIQQKLITSLTQRKKALAQQLLTGKTRLPGFEEPWETVKLGELLKEVRRPVDWSDENTYNLLSVRRRSGGLFHRDSLKGSEIKTKIMKTTKVGDFLIAKMQVVHGALAATTAEFDGMHVSGSYVTLVPRKPNTFHMPFFNYLSQTPLIYHLALISSYGVIIEKMTFNLKWFLQCEVVFPSTLTEQTAIAKILTTADRELALQTQNLTTLQTQKRALMQQLLTGKIRVNVHE